MSADRDWEMPVPADPCPPGMDEPEQLVERDRKAAIARPAAQEDR
jgi:hypothetical protein